VPERQPDRAAAANGGSPVRALREDPRDPGAILDGTHDAPRRRKEVDSK
jgi:hypothetical protein